MQLGLAFDVTLEKVDAFVVIDGYFDDGDAAVDALCLQRPLTVP